MILKYSYFLTSKIYPWKSSTCGR